MIKTAEAAADKAAALLASLSIHFQMCTANVSAGRNHERTRWIHCSNREVGLSALCPAVIKAAASPKTRRTEDDRLQFG